MRTPRAYPKADEGKTIPLPSRAELLAMVLPFEVELTAVGIDEHGDEVREPIIARFANERAMRAYQDGY